MKLYNKAKTGKIIEWSIEIEGPKFRAITGQVEGKLITGAWTTCEGKNVGRSNETTPEEQAIKEVEAKIIKKKEEGYKETITELDSVDGSVQEIVMLAEKWKDCQKNIPDDEILYAEYKYDGIRCKSSNYKLVSRKNKEFVSIPHILKEIQDANIDFELDGELYNHELKDNFNEIVSLVKRTKPTEEDIINSEKMVQYHVYDCMIKGAFGARYKTLQDLFSKHQFKYLKLVEAFPIVKSQVNTYHDSFVELGYEGIIIRRDTEYEYFRSKNLLKLKHWVDEEFKIVDVEEGTGNRSGMMGKFILKNNKDDSTFKANAKGTFTNYKEWFNNKHLYIGKEVTLRFQNYTPDNVPRFGTIVAIRDYE